MLPGGIRKHSGLRNATLHNVTVGDDTLIENVSNYIANYDIIEVAGLLSFFVPLSRLKKCVGQRDKNLCAIPSFLRLRRDSRCNKS